ncbi:Hypothetical predicted protein [Xyrichtys novacula]|uniref:Uncharacterized protein n=1 Tax=Xyrichtys novacula TaxID=13765 RepID=A0AAV1HC42_XYRNO|nr:Hypothetical predicted protein [Xyrichtys novacula]
MARDYGARCPLSLLGKTWLVVSAILLAAQGKTKPTGAVSPRSPNPVHIPGTSTLRAPGVSAAGPEHSQPRLLRPGSAAGSSGSTSSCPSCVKSLLSVLTALYVRLCTP